jgi:DNA end-binding protein Ku
MEALRRSVGKEAAPAKAGQEAAQGKSGQQEMLMPIEGKKPEEAAAKNPSARPQQKSA